MNTESDTPVGFDALGLTPAVLKALSDTGYEVPTPIQAEGIPPLLAGRDLLGQAQTGTGKTAAFALPILSNLDLNDRRTQVLVLTPTRELAIQVAEAFQTYARHLPGFHVLPIYGGQPYGIQLKQLNRGAQVVVGTPGRVMDHMRRGTLKLDALRTLVLDEADEMLRMGFIDDVEWVLTQTPPERQVALFSATMPEVIRRVAHTHLKNPAEVRIRSATTTATTIRQRYWRVSGLHKLDALTRLLETEPFDAMLIFVRTKTETVDLAERLTARGHACEALNGDIPQNQRERVVDRLKKGKLDILVATDVVARGLDVERISHVLNYDIPHDTESYVHRIGRTGRAGRAGEAILFVAPREQRMLKAIERATRQPIEPMHMPTAGDVNEQRVARFKERIAEALEADDLEPFLQLVTEYQQDTGIDALDIAAALAKLSQGKEPLLLDERAAPPPRHEVSPRFERDKDRAEKPRPRKSSTHTPAPLPLKGQPEVVMERFVVDVGHTHGLKPGNLVGAIANEAGLDSAYIGHIDIGDETTTVDLPMEMPRPLLKHLQGVWVCGRKLGLRPFGEPAPAEVHKRGPKGPKRPAGSAARKPAPRKGK
ncbi:MAG: DEAD/DEAH box helicase [Thioalkalivibrio sp.]